MHPSIPHRASSLLLTVVLVVAGLTGCMEEGEAPTAEPYFYSVYGGAEDLTTAVRFTGPDDDWTTHKHEDLGDLASCVDQAVGPDGLQRYLAFVHDGADDDWLLSVRRGLGPTAWSETFSGISIPDATPGPDNFPRCRLPRIEHLEGSRFGIVWIAGDELHNAVFDASMPEGEDLVLGEVVQGTGFQGVRPRAMSLVRHGDEVRLIRSSSDFDRIHMHRGTLTADAGIDFEQASTFLSHDHSRISDALEHDGRTWVATRSADGAHLFARLDTEGEWQEQAFCELLPTRTLDAGLLFADAAGDVHTYVETDQLLNFSDCSQTGWPIAVGAPRLIGYHGGG